MGLSIRIKKIIAYGITIVFSLGLFCTSIAAGQVEPPSGVQAKLAEISEEEKKTLQSLFTLSQEIEVMEQEEQLLAWDIESIKREIVDIEAVIAKEEASYEAKQEGLRKVLKSYQRMGPGSYIEIIMNSDSLTTFLRRINTLRDITRNTGVLLEQLQRSKDKLSTEKNNLADKLAQIEEKQKLSKEALENKQKLKKEMEDFLASLKGDKEYYEKQLAAIKELLVELKPVLSNAVKEFSSIIEQGSMPKDALKITFSLFGVKGAIDDKSFNEIISKQPTLSQMKFAFHQSNVEISMPEKNLVLSGNFVIVDGHILKFQPEAGSFFGMQLESEFIEALLSDGELALDLKPLLGKSTMQSITNHEGYIELLIKADLF